MRVSQMRGSIERQREGRDVITRIVLARSHVNDSRESLSDTTDKSARATFTSLSNFSQHVRTRSNLARVIHESLIAGERR